LYFGLLLVPWALLYGFTAYLFNHPTHFSSNQVRSVSSTKTLGPLFGASQDEHFKNAQLVCDELQRRFGTETRKVELLVDPSPRLEGNLVSTAFDWEENSYSVLVPLNSRSANVRITPKRKAQSVSEKAFFEVEGTGGANRGRGRQGGSPAGPSISNSSEVSRGEAPATQKSSDRMPPGRAPLRINEELETSIQTYVAELALQLHPAMAIELKSVRVNAVPELVFHVDSEGKQWECRHNPVIGSVAARSIETKADAAEFSWRRFLLRLHTAHTYPNEYNPRWFWAIIVDVMAFVMVFWGISGIVMWWQIKSTRLAGSIAGAVSLVAAVALGVAMFRAL
jgi:hypothetical protein